MKRVVLLADIQGVKDRAKPLTLKQIYQRKWRQSEAGKASRKRSREKAKRNGRWSAQRVAQVKRWRERNPVHHRVYHRILARRLRRESVQQQAAA